jgi:hypothetical protein
MDPVTAICLVSGILTFVSFGTKVVRGAVEIHESLNGSSGENQSRLAVADEMRRLAIKLTPPSDLPLAGEDKQLCALAAQCRALSTELVDLVLSSQPRNPNSKRQSIWASLKNMAQERERSNIEHRLDHCRSQLELQLVYLTRYTEHARLHSMYM